METLSREKILEGVIASLDISPSDFESARRRYSAVTNWLEGGEYQSGDNTDIYLQGSFRLGTVIRPYRNSQNADYDIDQVCEIKGKDTTAHQLKHDVGGRLKENGDYERMLDDEGRRCWTLQYASSDERPGFHLDVLPSRPANGISTHIDITHKGDVNYVWRSSNPKGYYQWFKGKNAFGEQLLANQKMSIFSANRNLYESVEDVPKRMIRTPLQRSIQLMKRHRDVYFDGRENSPISIILTTICTHKHQGHGILETISGFVDYVAGRLAVVISERFLPIDNVLDYQNEKWVIKNPADENENFADRWAGKPELAESFFAWVYQLRRDIGAFKESTHTRDLSLASYSNQERGIPYGQMLLRSMSHGPVGSNQTFLNLIHQGIEGKVTWDQVKEVAWRNVDQESELDSSKDVAWVNYYQVKIHSGTGLSDQNKTHVRNILRNRSSSPAFVLCCNLLLDSATAPMLQECIGSSGEEVLSWPITRLAKGQLPENSRMIIPSLR